MLHNTGCISVGLLRGGRMHSHAYGTLILTLTCVKHALVLVKTNPCAKFGPDRPNRLAGYKEHTRTHNAKLKYELL